MSLIIIITNYPWISLHAVHKKLLLHCYREQRQRYYTNRLAGIDKPRETLSLIIDGMDQNKTNIPHFVRLTKSAQNLWTLRTHLSGVLVHGKGNYGFFDFLQWPHDCNLTITCLLLTLLEITNKSTLPPHLYLQMDNCVRENKNKYVMAFLSLLVEIGMFSEVSANNSYLWCRGKKFPGSARRSL